MSPDYAALVVEDFGTSGLTGRTDEPGDTGNFRGFFYRHSILRQGRNGRRALGAGKAGVRPHVRLVVLVRADGPCGWQDLVDGKAAIGPRRSKASATLRSHAGRSSMTGLSGPSRISESCGGSRTASASGERRGRPGCRSWFRGRRAIRISRRSGAAC